MTPSSCETSIPSDTRACRRYVRGKRGIVERVYGAQGFQDEPTIADRSPQHVYSVSFDAVELWGANAEPNQRLYIDMWESWMEAAE